MAHFLNTSSNQVHSRVLREHSSSSVPQATIYSTPLCHLSLSLVWHGWHFGYLQHQLSHESHSFLYASSLRLDSWALWNPPHQRYWHNAILQSLGQVPFQKTPSQPPLFFLQVSYIVALDIWMVMSLVFIIVAMLETVFVTWMYQKGEQNEASVSSLYQCWHFFSDRWICCDWDDLLTGMI